MCSLLLALVLDAGAGVVAGRRAMGAVFITQRRNSGDRRMGNDVFSLERPQTSDSGRVCVFSSRPQQIRFRSQLWWAGCHWFGESVLCGGSLCDACKAGHQKRAYAFAIVDIPGEASRVARFSSSDIAIILARPGSVAAELAIGDVYEVARKEQRRPLSARFVKKCENLIEVFADALVLEVLRLHRIAATHADVRERAYWGLVQARVREACGGQRALFH